MWQTQTPKNIILYFLYWIFFVYQTPLKIHIAKIRNPKIRKKITRIIGLTRFYMVDFHKNPNLRKKTGFDICNIMLYLNSWSISLSPWNRGLLFTISAKMVPMDHMSMGHEYLGEPNNTSGARYHRVTTWNAQIRSQGKNPRLRVSYGWWVILGWFRVNECPAGARNRRKATVKITATSDSSSDQR